MIKPFYQNEHITLYNGDCIQVMRDNIANESIDLIVTDPPYLIEYKTNYRKYEHDFDSVIQNDNNPELIIDYIKECYRIMKQDTAMYMFCNFDKVDFFKQEFHAVHRREGRKELAQNPDAVEVRLVYQKFFLSSP